MIATEVPATENMNEDDIRPVDFSRIAVLLGAGTAAIGILGILGLYLSLPIFSGVIYGYKPIAFSAAVIWIFFGLVLAGTAAGYFSKTVRTAVSVLLLLIIFIQLIDIPLTLFGDHFFIEHISVGFSSTLLGVQTTPLSPVTSVMILPGSLGLLVLLLAPGLAGNHPKVRDITGILGTFISFISFIFLLSYLYGTPFFYGTHISPITLPSAVALFLFGLGLCAAAGPGSVPLHYFFGTSTRSRLLRTCIPLILAIILFDELLHIILSRYAEVNDALILGIIIAFFTLVTIIIVGKEAGRVSTAIDKAEFRQNLAETELRAAYEQLAAQDEALRQQYDKLARSQRELAVSEEQYRMILRTAMDGFCLIDINGAFIDYNEAFCSMLGYSREELQNLSLGDIESKESRADISAHMQTIITEGNDRFETRYRTKDGRIIDAEVSVVYDGPQNPRFITFHRDISEHIRVERALGQAKKKLNLLNMVTFTEIQNAIFSLTGYLQLVKAGQDDEKISRYTEKQEEIVKKISDTIQFAHSYQDMGMKPPRWQNVTQVFLLAISHLDFSGIRHRIQTNDLEIFADPLLEQVFLILANNSLTHGGKVTEVELFASEEEDGLRIIYEDNGLGIPPSLKDSLFNRDFRTKKGTGLFLVREILGITGISVTETGSCDRGARFEMFVPKEGYRYDPGNGRHEGA